MKHIFIINPAAGTLNIDKTEYQIYNECYKKGITCDIKRTEGKGDATDIAREATTLHSDAVIYSVGGDGTLNEVVNGIANTDATLGIIPYGSGNDFYKTIANDKKISDSVIADTIRGYLDGSIINTNICKINDRYFINISSIGLDANVTLNAQLMKSKKYIPNNMIYYASILYSLASFKNPKVNITINGQSLEQEITLLAMCNGKYYGNGIPIAPNACLNDNLLNICLADKISKAKIPFLLNGLMKMRHEEYPFVHVHTTDNIIVTSDELLACNIDGEIVRDNKFDVSIDGNVKVIKPTKSH